MKANKTATLLPLYWLAFLLGLLLRLHKLGAAPLSEAEASLALQALGLSHGGSAITGAQPAYILITSQLFSIMGNTNFLARFLPALAGSLLIWLPSFLQGRFRDSQTMKWAGVVMAFGLAIDPGLVSLSRQAGSLMPAVAFTLLALACFYNQHLVWAGIFAGLALLSGPAFLQGLLVLALGWGLFRLAGMRINLPQSGSGTADETAEPLPSRPWMPGVAAFILTLLVAGTLLLRAPQGLGALAETIPAYIRTWLTPSGIPVLRPLASLAVYQPLVLILGIIVITQALLPGWDDQPPRPLVLGLSLWAAVAIILPLVYAGRQVGDLAWALIPLWALAAIGISRMLPVAADRVSRLVSAGLALLLCIFAVIGWFNILAIGRYQVNVLVYWGIVIGAFFLGLIAVFLVAIGWSKSAAISGSVLSLCIILGVQMVSSTLGMAIVRQNGAQELWGIPPATGQADLFTQTLQDISTWNTGLRDQLEIVDLTGSAAMRWTLRNFPNARFESSLSGAASPPVVITLKAAEEPQLAQQYRGQDFVWRLYPGWQGVFPPDFINWLAFRKAQLNQDQVILWARSDVFPGGGASPVGNTAP